MKVKSGTFTNYGNSMEFIAVSRAHIVANTDASKIADAISNGTLPVHEISGCKAVTLADLMKMKSGGAE